MFRTMPQMTGGGCCLAEQVADIARAGDLADASPELATAAACHVQACDTPTNLDWSQVIASNLTQTTQALNELQSATSYERADATCGYCLGSA